MTTLTTTRRTWRSSLLTIVMLGAIAAALLAPTSASAICRIDPNGGCYSEPQPLDTRVSDQPGFKGYATVDNTPSCIRYGCLIAVSSTVPAWRWSGTFGWSQASRQQGQRVYVYPYGSGWSWTWTSGTGWLAMRSSHLVIVYGASPAIATTNTAR